MEHNAQSSEALFCEYVDCLSAVQPLKDYCTGLLTPCERKSVEPMAAPSRVCPEHPSLLHFVGQASWSDDAALDKARELCFAGDRSAGRDRGSDRR
jgi:SRSO17 transposase